jgi:hypothetical protein
VQCMLEFRHRDCQTEIAGKRTSAADQWFVRSPDAI